MKYNENEIINKTIQFLMKELYAGRDDWNDVALIAPYKNMDDFIKAYKDYIKNND
jgi:hypothetical protein